MTTNSLRLVGVLLAAAVSAPLFLASARPAAAHDGANEKIEHAMEDLNGSLKRLEKALAEKDAAKCLPLVLKMQVACQDSKVEAPSMAETITDAQKKADFLLGYRKTMVELQKQLLDLEVAVLDGKWEDATKLVSDKIKPSKKSGHDAYKPE
ncbi:MAG: cytochrome b562 [Planctomycetia bacterium]|jgi:hypothetical protein